MRQKEPRRSSIAWFKLAELVNRKEKERAFAMYRLLAHAFHNPAFAAQLEADLVQAFEPSKLLTTPGITAYQTFENKRERTL